MTDTTRAGSPTVAEIAALTARLRELSRPGREVDEVERAAFLADKQALLDRITAKGLAARDRAWADQAQSDLARARAEHPGYVLVGPSSETWLRDPDTGRPGAPVSESEHHAVRQLLGREVLDTGEPGWVTGPDGRADIHSDVIPAPTYEIDETDTGASSRAGDPEWGRREQLTRWHADDAAEAATDHADDGAEVSR